MRDFQECRAHPQCTEDRQVRSVEPIQPAKDVNATDRPALLGRHTLEIFMWVRRARGGEDAVLVACPEYVFGLRDDEVVRLAVYPAACREQGGGDELVVSVPRPAIVYVEWIWARWVVVAQKREGEYLGPDFVW